MIARKSTIIVIWTGTLGKKYLLFRPFCEDGAKHKMVHLPMVTKVVGAAPEWEKRSFLLLFLAKIVFLNCYNPREGVRVCVYLSNLSMDVTNNIWFQIVPCPHEKAICNFCTTSKLFLSQPPGTAIVIRSPKWSRRRGKFGHAIVCTTNLKMKF